MTVKYVAYIDESGDTGTSKLKTHTENGSSEWLVASCFLVRIDNDHKTLSWVKEIQSQFRNVQTPYLHFIDLLQGKKEIACRTLASKPCRLFVAMSNKKNIVGYKNNNIQDGNKHWLYWWLMRLLLEKVTDFCEQRTPIDQRGKDKIRIVFSRRNDLRYIDFANYIAKLRRQSLAGMLVIDQGDLAWSVVDDEEILAYNHKERAGLQLADLVASAFFQSVERNRPDDCEPTCASILKPRMAKNKFGTIMGHGIKTMPELDKMNLSVEQKAIFEYYGYSKSGW